METGLGGARKYFQLPKGGLTEKGWEPLTYGNTNNVDLYIGKSEDVKVCVPGDHRYIGKS